MDELKIEEISPKMFHQSYKSFMVGEKNWLFLFKFELLMLLFGSLPGGLGFLTRLLTFPALFQRCGRNVIFGRNLNLFVPSSISLGKRVIIEDYVTMNAKTGKINLDDGVFISKYCYLNSHPDGYIDIGPGSGLGLNTIVHGGGGVKIGRDVMVSPQCYIISQTYNFSNTKIPIKMQGIKKASVKIEDDVWIGAGTKILPGVTVGKGAIVGAASLVTHDIPPYSISYGIPARVQRKRQ